MPNEIQLADVVETPDGEGDVVAVDGDEIKVTLNHGKSNNALDHRETTTHSGWYKKSSCEK